MICQREASMSEKIVDKSVDTSVDEDEGTRKLPEGFDWKSITPADSPKTPMDVMADPKHQDLATPKLKEGDECFDFRSRIYDYSGGTEVDTGRYFNLLEKSKEKPVALIFGSYT